MTSLISACVSFPIFWVSLRVKVCAYTSGYVRIRYSEGTKVFGNGSVPSFRILLSDTKSPAIRPVTPCPIMGTSRKVPPLMSAIAATLDRPSGNATAESVRVGIFTTASRTTLGLYDPAGDLIQSILHPVVPGVTAGEHYDGVISSLVARLEGRRLEGIGVAVAGDVQGGAILRAGRLTPWREFNVTDYFARRIRGVRIEVENNTVAWALLEAKRNPVLPGIGSTLYAYLGNGVNGVIVSKPGFSCESLELGHMSVDPVFGRPKCKCTGTGCLEAFVGSAAITEIFRQKGGPDMLRAQDWSNIAEPLVHLLTQEMMPRGLSSLVLGGNTIDAHPVLFKTIESMLGEPWGIQASRSPALMVPSDAAVHLIAA
jgi:hypothetical protein